MKSNFTYKADATSFQSSFLFLNFQAPFLSRSHSILTFIYRFAFYWQSQHFSASEVRNLHQSTKTLKKSERLVLLRWLKRRYLDRFYSIDYYGDWCLVFGDSKYLAFRCSVCSNRLLSANFYLKAL
jgi:hypothetical protein